MQRRSLLKKGILGVTVGLSSGIAGCTGDGSDGGGDDGGGDGGGSPSPSDDDPSTVETTTTEPTTTAEPTTTERTTTERTTTEETTTERTTTEQSQTGPEIPTYEFSEGESYTYDAQFGNRQSEETWTVTAVDGDEVTVRRETTVDGDTQSQTITGTHSNIHDRVAAERDISYFGLARAVHAYAQEGDLTAGNSFTVDTSNDENTDWDKETVEVAGEATVNGVTCTEFTVRPEGVDQETTICLNEDYPFALSLELAQGGQTLIEMSLLEATRP